MSFMDRRFRPYAGIWIYCLTLIVVPVLFYFFFHYIVTINNAAGLYRPTYDAHFFSAVVGVGLCATSILTGALLRDFIIVVMRVSEFFADLRCGLSFREAFKWYKVDVKSEGAAFWILLVPILMNVANLIISIQLYNR